MLLRDGCRARRDRRRASVGLWKASGHCGAGFGLRAMAPKACLVVLLLAELVDGSRRDGAQVSHICCDQG